MKKLCEKLISLKFHLSDSLKKAKNDNRGMGVIEIVLIILVLVGLVIIFRTQITTIIKNIFSKVTKEINGF